MPPFKSPPPLSVMTMSGLTPSKIDKVATACAQLAEPTTASPTIKVLTPVFINASPLRLFWPQVHYTKCPLMAFNVRINWGYRYRLRNLNRHSTKSLDITLIRPPLFSKENRTQAGSSLPFLEPNIRANRRQSEPS